MQFDAHRQAPLGSEPESTEGDSRDAFALCIGATTGFIDAVDSIRGNAELSDPSDSLPAHKSGKGIAIAKLQAERQSKYLDRAQTLVARNAVAVSVLKNEERKSAGLTQPDAAHASAVRAQEIRSLYSALSPSEKNSVIHGDDAEVLKALYFAPSIGPALLDERSKEVIEQKLLSAHDPARHAAIAVRAEDARRSAYALEVAQNFIGRKRVPQPRVISSTTKR